MVNFSLMKDIRWWRGQVVRGSHRRFSEVNDFFKKKNMHDMDGQPDPKTTRELVVHIQ